LVQVCLRSFYTYVKWFFWISIQQQQRSNCTASDTPRRSLLPRWRAPHVPWSPILRRKQSAKDGKVQYWFPLAHCASLAFEPTAMIGVTDELKGVLKCNGAFRRTFAYPSHLRNFNVLLGVLGNIRELSSIPNKYHCCRIDRDWGTAGERLELGE
jgi:hypothetical protein